MILDIFLKGGVKWWHFAVAILLMGLQILDNKKTYKQEIDYNWKTGEIPSKLYKQVEEIHHILKLWNENKD